MHKIKLGLTTLITGFLVLQSSNITAQDAVATGNEKICLREQGTGPSLFVWDLDNLQKSNSLIAQNSDAVMPAYNALIRRADKALAEGPFSVTNKTKTPPSGSKADYYSIGPYWWPNPKKKSGLPYIRKDGEVNPERNDESFDAVRFSNFSRSVETLSLAAFFSEERKYADHAAELVRHWFLKPDTKMNPNLNFAQAIPGKTDGRGIGIIDSYRFVKVIDSIGILYDKGALTGAELVALRDWFTEYVIWMVKSENGQDERHTKNNHGTYYDAQLLAFSAFVGDYGAVEFFLKGVKDSRIPGQINSKGQMPLELKRTRPFHYTAFNLHAFFDIADVAECVGENLWDYKAKKGQGLKDAMSFQSQYAGQLGSWPFDEIRSIDPKGFHRNLLRAREAYNNSEFAEAEALYANRYKTEITALLYPG
jgi:hypothetical protein